MEVKVPDIGDFDEVRVIEILVSEGDEVEAEAPLVTLESDKATMDVPSPAAGTVKKVLVEVNDKVSEGTPILELEEGGDGEPEEDGEEAQEQEDSPEGQDEEKQKQEKGEEKPEEEEEKQEGTEWFDSFANVPDDGPNEVGKAHRDESRREADPHSARLR